MLPLAPVVIVVWLLHFASESIQQTADDTATFPRRYDYKHTFKDPLYYNHTVPFFDTFENALLAQDFIRLAPSVPNHAGSIWAQLPNTFKEWEVEFSFRIAGNFYVGGHGIAFWYAKDRGESGKVFGSKDQWDGLGVFFESADVVRERVHPLILGVLNNGTISYNNLTNPENSAAGGCYRQFRNAPNPVFVRVSHFNQTIKVAIDANTYGRHYHPCFEIPKVDLPTGYYFGVSASAEGETPDDHDIFGFETYEVNPPEKKDRPLRPHEQEKSKFQPPDSYEIPEDVKKRIEEVGKVAQPTNTPKDREDTRSMDFVKGMQVQILEALDMLIERVDDLGGTVFRQGQNTAKFLHGAPQFRQDASQSMLIAQKLEKIIIVLGNLESYLSMTLGGGNNEVLKLRQDVLHIMDKIDALESQVSGQNYQTQKMVLDTAKFQAAVVERSTTSKWWWIMYSLLLFVITVCGYIVYQARIEFGRKKFI